jgi:hypothetical protein
MIEYRALTDEEKRSATHFCNRCETVQKRGELHHCIPTERWKAAKAAYWAANGGLPAAKTSAHKTAETASEPASLTSLTSETFETDETLKQAVSSETRVSVSKKGTQIPVSVSENETQVSPEAELSVSAEAKPWEAEGVSRATYFRRKAQEAGA